MQILKRMWYCLPKTCAGTLSEFAVSVNRWSLNILNFSLIFFLFNKPGWNDSNKVIHCDSRSNVTPECWCWEEYQWGHPSQSGNAVWHSWLKSLEFSIFTARHLLVLLSVNFNKECFYLTFGMVINWFNFLCVRKLLSRHMLNYSFDIYFPQAKKTYPICLSQ